MGQNDMAQFWPHGFSMALFVVKSNHMLIIWLHLVHVEIDIFNNFSNRLNSENIKYISCYAIIM